MTCSPSRIRLQGVGIQHRCIIVGSVVQIVDSDGAANAVMENSLPGATVGVTASAQGLPTPVTYSLDDDAGGRFQINSSTGVVTTTGPLDYETATSHQITVRALGNDLSFVTKVFTIQVTDVADTISNISDSDATANEVNEAVVTGQAVGITAVATDPGEEITYSLDDDAGGRFRIHPTTGVVTVRDASLFDYETDTSHTITVRATSTGVQTTTQNFVVQVTQGVFRAANLVIQHALDATGYEPQSLDDVPVLESLEAHGTYRKPLPPAFYTYDGADDKSNLMRRLTSGALSELTVTAKIKSPLTQSGAIASEAIDATTDYGWSMTVTSSGQLQVVMTSDGVGNPSNVKFYSAPGISANTWHSVGFTFNSGDLKLYIDGSEISTTKFVDGSVPAIHDGAATFQIAWDEFPLEGSIAELRVYNTEKSAAEITSIHAGDYQNIDREGLVAGYWFNEGLSLNAYDFSGNGNHLLNLDIDQSQFYDTDDLLDVNTFNQLGYSGVWGSDPANFGRIRVPAYGNVTQVSLTFRGLLSNPQIMTFDNTTATGVSVNSGVLTFGGSLTPSNVQIDGVSVSNAQAGALINGGDFHTLSFDLATFNATDLRVGTDGSDFFPLAVHTLSLNNGTDSWRFQSETIEDVESTGVGPDAEPLAMFYATIPRDESEPEKDIAGGDLQYASRAPLPVAIRVPVLTFDGVDSYVDIDDGAIAAISPTGNYTFAMWINPASTSGVRHLISYPTDANSRHGMYIQNGVLKGGYRNSSTYFGAPAGNVSANQWQHVALVNNGGTLSMYVNGVATTGATSMSFLSAAERTIGGKSQYTSGYFSGPISDVRIYTESLSAADILDLYNGIEPDDTNLERHYPLQEGSGLTCYNTVANDSHGTLTDADVGVARATRSSGVQDYSVKFGCRPDSGASVPALRGGSVAANGGAITVPAPEVNPLALISRDPFDAAELNPIVDSPYLPAVDIEDEAPANTKFERKSSADGRDRLITTSAPLTGTDLSDIETYVGPLSLTDDTFLPDSFPLVD